jgi:hypothetical protein
MTQHNSSPSSKPKSFDKSAIGLFIFGLLFIGSGYGIQQNWQYKEKNFTKTTGKVIEDFNYSNKPIATDRHSSTVYVYKIDFIANGRLLNFTDINTESLDPFEVARDGTVTVIYDPKNPESAKAYRPYSFGSWQFFIYGGVTIIFSVMVAKPSVISS